ncbi:Uncharacterised protein [uncultured archaeon]|nr:Uncharacterised protein [uncultured archaeon]
MREKRFEHFYESADDIPLILDSYDDLFSDFDPRPYHERAMSGDFLFECKKASIDKRKKIHLRLFIPKAKRNHIDEVKIKKRMIEHFHKHFMEKKREISKIKLNGFSWFIAGSIMLLLSALLLKGDGSSLWHTVLYTFISPGGWFFMWEGLGKIFMISDEKKGEYNFYKKMSNALISFTNY